MWKSWFHKAMPKVSICLVTAFWFCRADNALVKTRTIYKVLGKIMAFKWTFGISTIHDMNCLPARPLYADCRINKPVTAYFTILRQLPLFWLCNAVRYLNLTTKKPQIIFYSSPIEIIIYILNHFEWFSNIPQPYGTYRNGCSYEYKGREIIAPCKARKAATAFFKSEQILLFALQNRYVINVRLRANSER